MAPARTDDTVRVVAAVSADELPGDLRRYAKEHAHRKVNRLLERISLAPFAAGTMLYERHPVGDPDRVALMTVSGWDPDTPEPAAGDGPRSAAEMSGFYQHPPGVGDYLQRMPNNAICQLSIANGFRGPNVHYTGGVDSLTLMSTVAAGHLADGLADAAVVVAFDVADGDASALPGTADTTAAAVLLALPDPDREDLGGLGELRAALDATPRPCGAAAALGGWIGAARRVAS